MFWTCLVENVLLIWDLQRHHGEFDATFPLFKNKAWNKAKPNRKSAFIDLTLDEIICSKIPELYTESLATHVLFQLASENRPSQKERSIPTIHFQVRTVSFRCIYKFRYQISNFNQRFNILPFSSIFLTISSKWPPSSHALMAAPRAISSTDCVPRSCSKNSRDKGHWLPATWPKVGSCQCFRVQNVEAPQVIWEIYKSGGR